MLQDHGLLDDVQEEERYYTSEERRQRHGERKRLGQLKREQNNESKKRKVLKFTEDVSRGPQRELPPLSALGSIHHTCGIFEKS